MRSPTVVVAALAYFVSGTVYAGPPDFPAPDGANVSVVADSMTVQGRSMAVRAFLSDDPVEDIVAFYQELWQEPPVPGAPGVAYEPDAMAPWQLLTRVEDGYVMTVQVQPSTSGGTYGYLALGRLPDPGDGPPEAPPAPPAMSGSKLQSHVVSDDAGKTAHTAMLVNTHSLASNVNFYREHYRDWRKDIDQGLAHDSLHALAFRRGRHEVIITIHQARDGSQIVVNSIKHDLL
ncbi:MAG: hypothetical protein RLW61_14805 [Gammaproteobacteria bacterium]